MQKSLSKSIKINGKSADSLLKLSENMGLSLSSDEMMLLQKYFTAENRDPTDVELNAMAQAWSEHCCYKSSKYYLKKYFRDLSRDYVFLAMEDDAAVVRIDDEYSYVVKMESHNHPSAIEPYGGAATGVGGIIRDVLCMGAQPIALVDSLFFGEPDYSGKKELSTRALVSGIVGGIRDYGNRVGIPTVSGSVFFDSSYNHNPLVNAGCIGLIKTDSVVRSRIDKPGYSLVIAGGRTGRDGIHGVNFASRKISGKKGDARSVQLGNPIVEEPLIHAILEMVEMHIIEGMKDLGGGGMSSAIGELVHSGGVGAVIHLEKVLLKEEGMLPWEIWVSESQERMLLAIKPSLIPAMREIFEKWGIEYSVVGETVDGNRIRIYYGEEKVLDLDLDFMTSGLEYQRDHNSEIRVKSTDIPAEPSDFTGVILDLLSDPNICSREAIVRQYDHTVRGNTIKGPFNGRINIEGPADSSVLDLRIPSGKKIVVTSGSRPDLVAADPFIGSQYCVAEAAMNIMASGGVPHSVVDCLNFGSPTDPSVMDDLIESIRGISHACRKFSIPVVSGNVSLYNSYGINHIKPTPVIMMVGLLDSRSEPARQYFHRSGLAVYVCGKMITNLAGSTYLKKKGIESGKIDQFDYSELNEMIRVIPSAGMEGIIEGMHDVSDGGLAVTLSEMTLGSGIGADLEIGSTGFGFPSQKLFSELGNRVVVTVSPENEDRFRKLFSGVRLARIGMTGGESLIIRNNGVIIANVPISEIREKYSQGLSRII